MAAITRLVGFGFPAATPAPAALPVAQALETDSALALTVVPGGVVVVAGRADETDEALPVTVGRVIVNSRLVVRRSVDSAMSVA